MEPPPAHASFSPGWSAYSEAWYNLRIPAWKKHLVPRLAGKRTDWLELGSYEGRSALWTLEHVLTHPASSIICADTWTNPKAESLFDANIQGSIWAYKVRKIKASSFEVLRQVSGPFDVVYVDADHKARSALQDAVMAWPLLRRGGCLIWDDYQMPPSAQVVTPPKPGIDAFLSLWDGEYEVLHSAYQVIIQKR